MNEQKQGGLEIHQEDRATILIRPPKEGMPNSEWMAGALKPSKPDAPLGMAFGKTREEVILGLRKRLQVELKKAVDAHATNVAALQQARRAATEATETIGAIKSSMDLLRGVDGNGN